MQRSLWLAALSLAVSLAARADEIRLKDGSKIVGDIVAFENDSFKVQTGYGFAFVRKDSIAQIIPATAKSKSADLAPADPAKTAASPTDQVQPATAPQTGKKPAPQPAVANPAKALELVPASTSSAPAPSSAAARPAVASSAPAVAAEALTPPSAVAAQPVPVTPPIIRESLDGNLYTNDTYGFQLYRPPGWDLLPQARNSVPNAITAMGTSDETTLFIIGREPVREVLEAQAADAERATRKIYENYRHISTVKRTIGGLSAVQWQFRGMADGHDWSVTALTIAHGSDVFTLLGMTYADSDLIQIRENVIAKMLASVQFTASH
jgi:hypothetical protein